ncbi:MAG: lipoyl(octanoyl) transferase [Flavobacteriales bacterium]|nr:lipoyl(octanoyl) transferase [Flavobacteriales bacterium]|tara:strand:+ start:13858 stop:14553 length:696 start_codon:yes stop_codon:yes gene_type:complete
MNKKVIFKDLGLIDYKKCWDYQEEIFAKTIEIKTKNRKSNRSVETKNTLIFCEHPHVYTLGKSGDENNLLVNAEYLKKVGASFYKINRGGDVTYHGPGQIVGYPILDLENFFTDIHKYLRLLEEAVILTLKEYGLNGERSEGETGVWLDVGSSKARKICALGVKTSRWVSMHGFAFNVNSDLSYFGNIVPCGIVDKQVTSLQKELNKEMDMREAKNKLKIHLVNLFEMELV